MSEVVVAPFEAGLQFIHSFSMFLSTYCVPDTLLDTRMKH